MLLSVHVTEKSFGSNLLYDDVSIDIQEKEKIGLIGRNGTGKSTLLHILTGEDTDYQGELTHKKGIVLVSSRQEHHEFDGKTVLEYIQGDLPRYQELTHIIDTYPETMGSNPRKIQQFSDALVTFDELGYYQLEDELEQAFETYQLPKEILHRTLGSLSGGQKRLVELVKVLRSRGNLALIDEPTNHMDYVAKAAFIKWLKSADEAVLVITHDRDVLAEVDRIIEIRDGKSYSFKGNYQDYLRANTSSVSSQVNEYDLTQRRIRNLEEDVLRFQRLKEKARDPGTIKRFKSQEQKARKELETLKAVEKPSFWIDQESVGTMNEKLSASYDKYKAKNIRLITNTAKTGVTGSVLVKVQDLSLGYDNPLFSGVSFTLATGERVRLHGRNGSGKTTLVQALLSQVYGTQLKSTSFAGYVEAQKGISLGVYEQEIAEHYLDYSLHDAIEAILRAKELPLSEQRIKQLLGDYLFNPAVDGDQPVKLLSGGQKARLQLINMLASDPQILILDEPTNHLDLPSIEELEHALARFHGAILYISHDTFFSNKLGGATVTLKPV